MVLSGFVCWCGFRDRSHFTSSCCSCCRFRIFIPFIWQANKQIIIIIQNTIVLLDICGGQKKKFHLKCSTFNISTTKTMWSCCVPDVCHMWLFKGISHWLLLHILHTVCQLHTVSVLRSLLWPVIWVTTIQKGGFLHNCVTWAFMQLVVSFDTLTQNRCLFLVFITHCWAIVFHVSLSAPVLCRRTLWPCSSPVGVALLSRRRSST